MYIFLCKQIIGDRFKECLKANIVWIGIRLYECFHQNNNMPRIKKANYKSNHGIIVFISIWFEDLFKKKKNKNIFVNIIIR